MDSDGFLRFRDSHFHRPDSGVLRSREAMESRKAPRRERVHWTAHVTLIPLFSRRTLPCCPFTGRWSVCLTATPLFLSKTKAALARMPSPTGSIAAALAAMHLI